MHECNHCNREFGKEWRRDEHERVAHGVINP